VVLKNYKSIAASGVDLRPLTFLVGPNGSSAPWRFFAGSMSDGTLRVLGILVALFQSQGSAVPSVPLVGIEEPEVALHPAAVGALLDALREASQSTQVIVTTHSPDLLDFADMDKELLLAVWADKGATQIAPVDEASREALREKLYTPGELLRLDQLRPDDTKLFGDSAKPLPLFDGAGL
jgi:predicted ATPase